MALLRERHQKIKKRHEFLLQIGVRDVLSFQRRQTLLLCDMQLIFFKIMHRILFGVRVGILVLFYRATQTDGGGFICLSV